MAAFDATLASMPTEKKDAALARLYALTFCRPSDPRLKAYERIIGQRHLAALKRHDHLAQGHQ